MSKLRTGTLWCWIFGHKFLWKSSKIDRDRDIKSVNIHKTDFCARCGLSGHSDKNI